MTNLQWCITLFFRLTFLLLQPLCKNKTFSASIVNTIITWALSNCTKWLIIITEFSGFIQSPVLSYPLVSLRMNLEPASMLSLKISLVTPLLYLEIMKYRPCNMRPIPLTSCVVSMSRPFTARSWRKGTWLGKCLCTLPGSKVFVEWRTTNYTSQNYVFIKNNK